MNIISKVKLFMLKTTIINMIPIIPIYTENKFVCWLWSKIYFKWVSYYHREQHYRVIAVTGWRTMILQQQFKDGKTGLKESITPCFWGLE